MLDLSFPLETAYKSRMALWALQCMYRPSRINSTHNSVSSSFSLSSIVLLLPGNNPVTSILLSPSCFPPPRPPYLTTSPFVRANNSTVYSTSLPLFDAAALINGDSTGFIFSLFVLVLSQTSVISFTSSSDGKSFAPSILATVETFSSKFGFTFNAYAESTCGCT